MSNTDGAVCSRSLSRIKFKYKLGLMLKHRHRCRLRLRVKGQSVSALIGIGRRQSRRDLILRRRQENRSW